MKPFIVVLLLAVANADYHINPNCVTIRNVSYEKEVLNSGLTRPYQLVIDHDTHTLFFSYTSSTNSKFEILYISLKTRDYGVVSGMYEGFGNAVDSRSSKVYMGGGDGIYTYNYDTNTVKKTVSDVNIWQMFYKNGLYFTVYPDQKAFLYKQGKVEPVTELTDNVKVIAVKNDGTYLYSNSEGLYAYNKTVGHVQKLGNYVVIGFSTDIDGNIYFCTSHNIYYMDDKTNDIEQLYYFDRIYGVAIDANGHIIYSTKDSVIKLNPNKNCT